MTITFGIVLTVLGLLILVQYFRNKRFLEGFIIYKSRLNPNKYYYPFDGWTFIGVGILFILSQVFFNWTDNTRIVSAIYGCALSLIGSYILLFKPNFNYNESEIKLIHDYLKFRNNVSFTIWLLGAISLGLGVILVLVSLMRSVQ